MAASTLSLPVPVSSRPARESGIRSMPRAVHVMAPRAHTGVKLRHREEAELAFRQLTRQQGDALEAIAHAIEYLVDNGLPHRLRFDNTMLSDGEAIAILQRAGRASPYAGLGQAVMVAPLLRIHS